MSESDKENAPESPGARVRALRKALDWTQDRVARRSGGNLTRKYVAHIETGHNLLTSWRVREGLAKAFAMSLEQLDRYLTGASDLAAVAAGVYDAVQRQSGQMLLDDVTKVHEDAEAADAAGTRGDVSAFRVRDLPEWPTVLTQARKALPRVPAAAFDEFGDLLLDTLDPSLFPKPLDAETVGMMACGFASRADPDTDPRTGKPRPKEPLVKLNTLPNWATMLRRAKLAYPGIPDHVFRLVGQEKLPRSYTEGASHHLLADWAVVKGYVTEADATAAEAVGEHHEWARRIQRRADAERRVVERLGSAPAGRDLDAELVRASIDLMSEKYSQIERTPMYEFQEYFAVVDRLGGPSAAMRLVAAIFPTRLEDIKSTVALQSEILNDPFGDFEHASELDPTEEAVDQVRAAAKTAVARGTPAAHVATQLSRALDGLMKAAMSVRASSGSIEDMVLQRREVLAPVVAGFKKSLNVDDAPTSEGDRAKGAKEPGPDAGSTPQS